MPSSFSSLSSVPFQVQIRYTKMDGTKCVRIISSEKKISKDRTASEKDLNVSVMALNGYEFSLKFRWNLLTIC